MLKSFYNINHNCFQYIKINKVKHTKANQLFYNHLISNYRENTKITKYPVKKSIIIELPSVSWLLNQFSWVSDSLLTLTGFTKCLSLLVRMKRIYSLLNKQNSQNPMDNSSQICFGVVSKFLKCYADGVNLLYLDAYISVICVQAVQAMGPC